MNPPPTLPQDPISTTAYTLATQHLPTPILNHSLRVYKYAQTIGQNKSSPWTLPPKLPLLFASTILHDIGSAPHFSNTPQRFEVEGADIAASHLRQFAVSESDIHEVWTAIALHTSPGIAERISELACIVREAVLVDFRKWELLDFGDGDGNGMGVETRERLIAETELHYPRLAVEKVLGNCVVEQARERPEKAPAASWPGILLRSALEDPEYKGVNRAF